MSSRRQVDVVGGNWFEIGAKLAGIVSEKSLFAYRYDRDAYSDELDIQKLWQQELGPHAKLSMPTYTPNAFEFCSGFDSILSSKGGTFNVWELLTIYEVDMYLHEFHYKCKYCEHRIMTGARYVCSPCQAQPKSTKKKDKDGQASVCEKCLADHTECPACNTVLTAAVALHETDGLGIANKSGCTGFGYACNGKTFCGQTLEMSTDTYNFGRFDTIYKLTNTSSNVTILVYDVGCILSPFGLNSAGMGLCVFNLYNSDYSLPPYKSEDSRVPMAAVQWEILMRGSPRITDTLKFIESIRTFTSASFVLSSKDDQDAAVIEITANENWIPSAPETACVTEDDQSPAIAIHEPSGGKFIVRANNCLAGSSVKPTESLPPNISSHQRQRNLFASFRDYREEPSPEWVKTALSTETIQTEYCLGTVVIEPQNLRMQVRFRVGTRISSTLKDGGKWETFSI